MIKLFGRHNSDNCNKATWCLGELELKFDMVLTGRGHSSPDSADFLALNPNGLVPVLDDDGFILWESNTIVRYLAAKYGPYELYPTAVQDRSECEKWMDWQTNRLEQPLATIQWNLLRYREQECDHDAVSNAAKQLSRCFRVLDEQLRERKFVAGDQFTVGDIPAGVMVYRWLSLAIERPRFIHLQNWYDRLTQRSAFREYVMVPLS